MAQQKMTVDYATVVKAAVKKSAGIIQAALAILVIIYIVFAATLISVVPGVPGGAGFVLTKNTSFYGGIIPVSSQSENKERVLIDTSGTHDGSVVDRLKIAFVPNSSTAVVDVWAGPTGKIDWFEPDIISVNGHPLPGKMFPVAPADKNPRGNPVKGQEYLYEQYLGICHKGACEDGEVIMFTLDQVIGTPVK